MIYVFTNPSTRAGCDTRSIIKRSFPWLNSEFFLLLDLLPNQEKRTQTALIFTHRWREIYCILNIARDISAVGIAISPFYFLVSPCLFHLSITTKPQATYIYIYIYIYTLPVHIYIYIYMFVCVCVCVCVCVWMCL